MIKGFIFNSGKCVACGACSAACSLENGREERAREIYTFNGEAFTALPVVNLSLACNHCENPACLESCPSGCYSRDTTGAIILDDSKCLGCKYCQWNCPYDAPKFNSRKGIMEKCTLCASALKESMDPSCVSSCPTGALKYGELPDERNLPVWFPDPKHAPALAMTSKHNVTPLRMVPGRISEEEKIFTPEKSGVEWSLVLFSFLSVTSVSIILSFLLKGVFPEKISFVVLLILTGVSPFFHLGKPLRAFRALANIRTSPISREIAFFLLFSAASISALLTEIPVILLFAAAAGLIFLASVDLVYTRSAGKGSIFDNGQAFINSLLLASFLAGSIIPFTFVLLLKLVLSIRRMFIDKFKGIFYEARYLSISIMLIIWAGIFSGFVVEDIFLTLLLLIAILIDRIIFYIDFEPENIARLIEKHIYSIINEKKRG